MASPPYQHAIVCVECGETSVTPATRGWCGYLIDLDESSESPALAFYCPACALAEFGHRPTRAATAGPVTPGRRWRDAHEPAALVFRVVLETASALALEDEELASALDVIAEIGGSDVVLSRGGEAEATRVEFDLAAQNDGHARRLALELLEPLAERTPSVGDGWIFASLSPV